MLLRDEVRQGGVGVADGVVRDEVLGGAAGQDERADAPLAGHQGATTGERPLLAPCLHSPTRLLDHGSAPGPVGASKLTIAPGRRTRRTRLSNTRKRWF